MKHDEEPTRLEHTDDPIVRQAIGAARRELPDAERMQRLSLALAAKLGPGPGGGPDGSPPPADGGATAATAATGATTAVKATALVTAIVVAGGIGYFARTPTNTTEIRSIATASAVVTSTPSATTKSEVDPIPTLSVDELAPLAPSAKTPTKAAPSASVSDTPGETDLGLLRRAQSTLGSDAAGTLALCAAHERTFPRSPYAQEREVLTIEALIRLGRRSEAVARADRFAKAFPSSGHNRRIDSLLGR